MKTTHIAATAFAAAAVALPAIPAAGAAGTTSTAATTTASAAASRHFEGTVLSIDRPARTFRLRDAERGTVTIRVSASTTYERVSFSSLRSGLRSVEATVRRSGGAWVAVRVERSGGGGNHGGGTDDGGRGRGSDDAAGDDRGGRGRGSDDAR